MNYQDVPLINNEAKHNFEMMVEGQRAFIDYQLRDGKIYLVHTEVPHHLQGRGIAAVMVEKAFQYIEANHLILVPICPYVQHYLQRHPQWEYLTGDY
jgi:predicted GNAT family acetyltransferase